MKYIILIITCIFHLFLGAAEPGQSDYKSEILNKIATLKQQIKVKPDQASVLNYSISQQYFKLELFNSSMKYLLLAISQESNKEIRLIIIKGFNEFIDTLKKHIQMEPDYEKKIKYLTILKSQPFDRQVTEYANLELKKLTESLLDLAQTKITSYENYMFIINSLVQFQKTLNPEEELYNIIQVNIDHLLIHFKTVKKSRLALSSSQSCDSLSEFTDSELLKFNNSPLPLSPKDVNLSINLRPTQSPIDSQDGLTPSAHEALPSPSYEYFSERSHLKYPITLGIDEEKNSSDQYKYPTRLELLRRSDTPTIADDSAKLKPKFLRPISIVQKMQNEEKESHAQVIPHIPKSQSDNNLAALKQARRLARIQPKKIEPLEKTLVAIEDMEKIVNQNRCCTLQ
ncbi:MAG: hypothetical protein P4L22_06855 [Candidatus Babeliales bacterium]|nr:hypothetical protein [Candidatus Babeliales bacterium]